MNKNFNLNNIENNELTQKTEECDYKNLITRLEEISLIISLLENKVFK